jgi:hypothetical protein
LCEAYHEECAHHRSKEIEETVKNHNEYKAKENIDITRIEKAILHIEKGIDTDLGSNEALQNKASTAFTIQGLLLSVVIGVIGSSDYLFSMISNQEINSFLVLTFILFSIASIFFGAKVIQSKPFIGKGTTAQGWLDLDYLENTNKTLEQSLNLQILGNYAIANHQNSLSLRTNKFFLNWQIFLFQTSLFFLFIIIISIGLRIILCLER